MIVALNYDHYILPVVNCYICGYSVSQRGIHQCTWREPIKTVKFSFKVKLRIGMRWEITEKYRTLNLLTYEMKLTLNIHSVLP